jgi:hypothetical protein
LSPPRQVLQASPKACVGWQLLRLRSYPQGIRNLPAAQWAEVAIYHRYYNLLFATAPATRPLRVSPQCTS